MFGRLEVRRYCERIRVLRNMNEVDLYWNLPCGQVLATRSHGPLCSESWSSLVDSMDHMPEALPFGTACVDNKCLLSFKGFAMAAVKRFRPV